MANEYEAKVDIDTSQADRGLKNVDKSVASLDRTIKSLDGSLQKMQQSMSASARAMQESNKAQRESATASDRSAVAALKSARAREMDSKAALNQARTEGLQRREREAATRANEGAANSFQAVTGAVRGYSAGAQEAANANSALSGSMSNTRYLLYDIGATYSAISIALLAIPAATTTVAASFEKDFAQVERTTGGASLATQALKGDIKELAESIPLAFGDLTKITALGAQLGVATTDLSAFTEVVAKFSASTGVVAEEAGAAFGRIGSAFGLTAGEYEKLGSSIAKVGVSSAATESEIIAITQQLAPLASLAGFSAQEVVGLSGALASMRIRPELARGAFQATIFKITEATEAGGKSLQAYADVMGITGDQVTSLYKTNPAQFFQDYITGIGKAMEKGQSFSSVLDGLGVKEKRERQFILAMANQYGFLGDQIKLANDSYAQGTFLDEASAPVFETLAANLQKLGNSLANLGDSLGSGGLKSLSALVGAMADGAGAAADFIEATPGLKILLSVLLGYGAIMGVFFAIRSAMAFVLAALVGFQQVASKSALATTFSLKGIAAQAAVTRLVTQGATAQMAGDYVRLAGISKAMSASIVRDNMGMATSIVATGGAFKRFSSLALSAVGGVPGVIIGALTAIGLGFFDAQQKAEAAGKAISSAFEAGQVDGIKAIADQLNTMKVEAGDNIWLGNLGKSIRQVGEESGVAFDSIVNAVSKGKDGAAEFGKVLDEIGRKAGGTDYADAVGKGLIDDGTLQRLTFLRDKVANLSGSFTKSTADAEATKKVVKALGGEGAEAMDELKNGATGASSAIDVLTKNISDAVNEIFGLDNAAAASEEAMYRLGQSLQESNDLSIGTVGGRENLSNAQSAVTKYAQSLAQAQADGVMTAQQAATEYASFVDGLFKELVGRGVDPVQAADFITKAKGIMGEAAAAGGPVNVPVGVDGTQVASAATQAVNGIDVVIQSAKVPTVYIDANADNAVGVVAEAQNYVYGVADQSYGLDVSADTTDAVGNTAAMEEYLFGVTGHEYVAPVNADTSAGINNLQNFANFAQSVIAGIQYLLGGVQESMPSAEIGNVRAGEAARSYQPKAVAAPRVSVPQAPAQVPTPSTAGPSRALGSLGQGYDDAAAKAKKAGDAGNKAGKDAANGIDEASEAVSDYAQRLSTGLTAAYDLQYGLQKATDDYYTQLNTINKKREDELKTISDLVDKQKELNIARQGDLVDARKAQIEADISAKYGEVDRAADYRQQADEAKNSAAEKQKNIDTAKKEQETLQAGIGKLTGYTQAAIDNRAALRELESKSLQMIVAYAATGASTEKVRAYAVALSAQWRRDVAQMGFNMTAVAKLQGGMQRYVDVINRVPRTKAVTVTANTGQATGAIQGVQNALGLLRDKAVSVALTYRGGLVEVPGKLIHGQQVYRVKNQDGSYSPTLAYNKGGQVQGFASGGLIPGQSPSDPSVDNMFAKVDGKGMVGIRSGEFITQQPAVDYWGLDFMQAINNMKMPRYNVGGEVGSARNSGSSAPGNSGPQLVELTAENIAAIQRMPQVNLYADSTMLAQSVSDGNAILASTGAN